MQPFSARIPVNLVPVVYCSVISEGADQEWNYLWKKFESENVAAEQVTILNALGCTKHANLITVNDLYFFHLFLLKYFEYSNGMI